MSSIGYEYYKCDIFCGGKKIDLVVVVVVV
jgi:hypothetical protein